MYPIIVISFKLSRDYGLQWSPGCSRKMPQDLVNLLNELEPIFPKMIEYQCDIWEDED